MPDGGEGGAVPPYPLKREVGGLIYARQVSTLIRPVPDGGWGAAVIYGLRLMCNAIVPAIFLVCPLIVAQSVPTNFSLCPLIVF